MIIHYILKFVPYTCIVHLSLQCNYGANILVRSTMSPTCLAADLYVLLAPNVWQCHWLSW